MVYYITFVEESHSRDNEQISVFEFQARFGIGKIILSGDASAFAPHHSIK